MDLYRVTYDKIFLTGDFNAKVSESCLSDFLYENDLKCIVKENMCFKNLANPSCVDLFLTNFSTSFQNTMVVCTDLSDFHKMIITVHKCTFPKAKPKIIHYRCYKNFNNESFRLELKEKMSICEDYEEFENTYMSILSKHAPIKMKTIRINQVPYMTKTLRKAIMRRSNLANKFLKTGSPESNIAYKKQRNYCSRLYKKERKKFYYNLDTKDINDNKKFWGTIEPFLSDKGLFSNKITLIESETILADNDKVAETLNYFFSEAPGNLDIVKKQYLLSHTDGLTDPIDVALTKFEQHPSILEIRSKVSVSLFSFNTVPVEDVVFEIMSLNSNKASAHNNIPVKNSKQNSDISSPVLHFIINKAIIECIFPDKLKYADIAPLHKCAETTNKKNYRPISMLPLVSKVFERILHKQIGYFIDEKLFRYVCGYRKGYNTQYALMALLEQWRTTLDNQGYAGIVIVDLSKAFDTVNYELLLAKLHAYGFGKSALTMVNSYLTNRWHRTKINSSYSTWRELLSGVPQGSILGPLLFNIYLNDLFFILDETNVCNYADDTGLHACDKELNEVIRCLEHDSCSN